MDEKELEKRIKHHCVMKEEWGQIQEKLIDIKAVQSKDYANLVDKISVYQLAQTSINQQHEDAMVKFSGILQENGVQTKLALNDRETQLLRLEVEKIRKIGFRMFLIILASLLGIITALISK